MPNFKTIFSGYAALAFGLFLYSYTQVDLNLTLSQWSIWQIIQTSFQHIGWFQRPLSTIVYLLLLFGLFAFYFLLLLAIKKRNIIGSQFWRLTLVTSIILLFSYNAFSYDLFNYMFDARIVTLHHENPYMHKALDYMFDPWINFMRWTHRTYPYGPVWLIITVPLSFIGFQFFLPTLFLFKALMVGSYLLAIYFIGKILEEINPKQQLFGMALFAFNPLVITESLVSAHQDIVMMALVLGSFYLLIKRRYVVAIILFLLSAGIKFATILLLPIFLLLLFKQVKNQSILWNVSVLASISLMIGAIVLATIRTEFQPWYLLWALPFFSFLKQESWIPWSLAIVSIGALIIYSLFLYAGNWDSPIPTVKYFLIIISFIVSFVPLLASKWKD